MEPIAVIGERTSTFADEWQARDIPLTRIEAAKVKRACEKLGLPLGHQPTGRTVHLILQHCQALALKNMSESTSSHERRAWGRTFRDAKVALGQMLN